MKNHKVFCIGFHKTGTTSLAKALRILGYRTVHGDGKEQAYHQGDEGKSFLQQIHDGNYYLSTFDQYDAFTDNPYFMIWDKILEIFPNEKYILTIRDEDSWMKSIVYYYRNRRIRPMRYYMFGEHADPSSSPEAKETWLKRYREHNRSVKEHFRDKDNLLIMDITKGDGFAKLCEFLNEPHPKKPFPYANNSVSKKDKKINLLKKIFPPFITSRRSS